MAKKKLSIDDLLEALKNPNITPKAKSKQAAMDSLVNNTETWRRIGENDRSLATDLGIKESELNDFLKNWVEDNPYSNI